MKKLAIVIPAYKSLYFRDALNSVVNQTNKNFNLYIADDNSPDDLSLIVEEFMDKMDIVYKKFVNNLGGENLVNHWKRSIELCANEEWIWLFSDDDLMPEDAVERFFNFIESHKNAELVRFNSKIIDKESNITFECSLHPEWESAVSFLNRRFIGEAYSFIVEYVFKKELYLRNGGIVNFPAAWASDDATWALFGKEKGIFTISGEPVLWRQSGINISSDKTNYSHKKIDASIKFVQFIKEQNFNIKNLILINWLHNQFKLLVPTGALRRYFLQRIVSAKDLSGSFKLLLFYTLFKRKIKEL